MRQAALTSDNKKIPTAEYSARTAVQTAGEGDMPELGGTVQVGSGEAVVAVVEQAQGFPAHFAAVQAGQGTEI